MSIAAIVIAMLAGALAGRAAAALLFTPRMPGAWLGGLAGGLGGSMLAGILHDRARALSATARSGGVDLGVLLGSAALGALGGIAVAVVLCALVTLRRR
jgi:hypothetical protein